MIKKTRTSLLTGKCATTYRDTKRKPEKAVVQQNKGCTVNLVNI